MNTVPFQALACPLDGEPLHLTGGAWRCAAGHSFDIAKQGYVNLLPVQQKRSTDPGDSKAMVAARQRFLGSGHYQPIAEAVSRTLLGHAEVPSRDTDLFSCLDAGCGEGYYLRQLVSAASSGQALSLVGLDISKWAVLAAAKQDNKQAPFSSWLVGSNYPSLKEERASERAAPEGFAHLRSESFSYQITLESKAPIADLLAMTPHLYRASVEGRARAEALDVLTLTVDVRMVQWQRV